jgi:DamX protein
VLHICALAALLALIIILFLYRGHDATPSATVERANEAALATDNRHSVTLALPTAAVRTAPPEAAVVHPAPQPVAASVPLPVPIPVSSAAQQSAPKVLQPKPVSIKPPVTVPDASKSIDQPAQPVAAPGAAGDERKLLAMAPTQFVLQVSGGESRGNIDKFVTSAGSGQPMLTYRTRLRGKPWIVVVTGPYSSRDAALAAIAKLPETLRKQQPWPRSAASVQADIRAYTEKL